MNTMQVPKQLVEINKITIDNTFKAILFMQDHSSRITAGIVEKAGWIPANGKKAINDWLSSCTRGIEDLKSASDKNYEIISNLFGKEEGSINITPQDAK